MRLFRPMGKVIFYEKVVGKMRLLIYDESALHLRLKYAGAVAFGVSEGDIETDTGNIHRFAENLSARFAHFLHGVLNIVYRDNYRRILCRPVGFLWEKAAIDGAGRFDHVVLVGFRGVRHDVISHVFAESLHVPVESLFIKRRDAIGIFIGHLEMNDGVFAVHTCEL